MHGYTQEAIGCPLKNRSYRLECVFSDYVAYKNYVEKSVGVSTAPTMKRVLFYFARRCSSSSAGQWENGVLLRNRGLIEVTGVDGRLLVNGLATADVLTAPLSTQYNMFLNTQVEISQDTTRILYTISAQGRVLYDSLIYHVNEERMLIECDRIIERKLLNHLKMYALRKKVS